MAYMKLQSSEGEIFDVEVEVAKTSTMIKNMLENGNCSNREEPVPLPSVKTAILKKVIEWTKYHKDDPPPLVDDDIESKEKCTDITSWDAEFMRVDQRVLIDLTQAAHYMGIQGLLELGCKVVANMIKGKTPEEIRKHFNITNDFTPEEEEQVRKENEWCEEK